MAQKTEPYLINGREARDHFEYQFKELIRTNNYQIRFTIVQVGDEEASNKYIRNKMAFGSRIGISCKLIKLDASITQDALEQIIREEQEQCDGIILQLPLPQGIDKQKALDVIDFKKDVDGLTSKNSVNFYSNQPAIVPATALGIQMLLNFFKIEVKDKKVYVIGESNLVGKPIAKLMRDSQAIVRTFNIDTGIQGSEEADILIIAAGSAKLVKAENVKKGAIIIDVGINTLSNKEIVGDLDVESVKDKISAYSPVPGGVGLMTVTALFMNLIKVAIWKRYQIKIYHEI